MSASPTALVTSSCCGASSGIERAFKRQVRRPKIIFGSTDKLYPIQYVAAWSILYYRFETDGFKISAAKRAVDQRSYIPHLFTVDGTKTRNDTSDIQLRDAAVGAQSPPRPRHRGRDNRRAPRRGAHAHGLETGARRSPFSRRPGCQPGDGLVTSSFAAPRSGAIVAGRRIMSLARAALFPGDLRRGRPKKGRRAHA